jgi:hypothetical protein
MTAKAGLGGLLGFAIRFSYRRRCEQSGEGDMASKSTTLSAINRGGIATLADGSCWHISSSELLKAKGWRIGTEVVIQSNKLTNIETGVQVYVVPIPLSAERLASN